MVLLLRNEDIVGLMPFEAYVEAVEAGYREVGEGRGKNVPRTNLWMQGDRRDAVGGGHLKPGSRASFKYKAAMLPGLGAAGVQAYTAGLPGGLETYLFLFELETGRLAAIMEVLYYDWLKTAAVAAVATRHLAPAGAATAALFGTGRHARTQLRALVHARPITRVQVYGRDPERRRAFCEREAAALGIEVVPAASPAEALRGAQVVTTMTTSPTPVFDGRDLPEGPVHVNAMGAHYPWVREVDEHVVLRSRIVLDQWEQGFEEQGEIIIPMEAGRLDAGAVHADLGQVVAGRKPGREPGTGWTLFLSGGTGVEDVAVGARIYETAKACGVGTGFEFGRPYAFALEE